MECIVMGFDAHSENSLGRREPLREHLQDVAETASKFASKFGAAEEARLTGLLHDLGKYAERFQRRLEGKERGLDHWSIGAWVALEQYRSVAVAAAIQGHHVGLQSLNKDSLRGLEPQRIAQKRSDGLQLTETDSEKLLSRLRANGLNPVSPTSLCYGNQLQQTVSAMLDVRMLFSALVDADYLETEAHFQAGPGERKRHRKPGPILQAAQALEILKKHVAELAEKRAAVRKILRLRAALLDECLMKAQGELGLYTLSAPTGAGKTLSMLAFALEHARIHQLDRVVVVIPYLSIIEQTARTYREIFLETFGEHYVLEHHSLTGLKKEDKERLVENQADDEQDAGRNRARLLAENWDAPLIVTTSVQMLESLFANRPGSCRKLHRLARSVILFDEVQTLPLSLAVPTLAALSHLASRYHSTVVFATATQPAFTHLDKMVSEIGSPGWRPREIVSDVPGLFAQAKRVRITPPDMKSPLSWQDLAGLLALREQVLCVVNLKRHALELLRRLEDLRVENLFHLSTNLCPAHREEVLQQIKEEHLKLGRPCRVVSTQCVEAGVDVDFPVVFRALGPLDSIAQAAGRCNRNGNLAVGEVHVFLPEEDCYPPGGGYERAASTLRSMLAEHGPAALNIDEPNLFEAYYRKLYGLIDLKQQKKELTDAIRRQDFVQVAQEYRLIEKNAINVVVPYEPDAFRQLSEEARQAGITASWIKSAQPYAVSLFRPARDSSVWSHLEPIKIWKGEESLDWFICREGKHYDRRLKGLDLPDSLAFLLG